MTILVLIGTASSYKRLVLPKQGSWENLSFLVDLKVRGVLQDIWEHNVNSYPPASKASGKVEKKHPHPQIWCPRICHSICLSTLNWWIFWIWTMFWWSIIYLFLIYAFLLHSVYIWDLHFHMGIQWHIWNKYHVVCYQS